MNAPQRRDGTAEQPAPELTPDLLALLQDKDIVRQVFGESAIARSVVAGALAETP